MTRFEFYKAIVNSQIISNSTNPTDIALREYALAQYDKQAQEMEDRAEKSAIVLSAAIDLLKNSDSPIAASDVAEKCDCSVQKASAVLRKAVTDGLMVSTPVLNRLGKSFVKGYSLASRYF
jgi:hypothetical protein